MSIHAIDKLMAQTRLLAMEYYLATGKTLPVTPELARYDAMHNLQLEEPNENSIGIDAIGTGNRAQQKIQIKGRVIFDEKKNTYRIGQFNLDSQWQLLLLVLLNANYHPFVIYQIERQAIDDAIKDKVNTKRSKRGAMSIAKLKAIGKIIWTTADGEITE